MSKYGSRYTDDDLKNNFTYTVNKCGYIPLFNDFKIHSKISLNTYANRLKFKGTVYDDVVKLYSNDNDYADYIKRKNIHKTNVGKITGGLSKIFSDDMLETNLRYIFDRYMMKYTKYPSRRLFDNISPIDSSQYRKRYKKSWTEICKSYGYIITSKFVEETICVKICSELFNSNYISQKTWDWLIGFGGKNMFCDGYFDELKLNIEFDGSSHRIAISKFGGEERLVRTKENDKLKEILLKDHSIKTIRIDSRLKWYTTEGLIKIIIDECENRGYDYNDFFILPETNQQAS